MVWLDDGFKSAVVAFGEDYFGNKLVGLPIEGHPDPETGELNVTEVLTTEHDWAQWHEYRLVRDAAGMIELFVDGDPAPILSYSYETLNMDTFGAGAGVMFGTLIEGENSRVKFEIDKLDYSVGMADTDGCASADGKVTLLYAINDNRVFDPGFDTSGVALKVKIDVPRITAGGSSKHTYLLRALRTITDEAGRVIRTIVEDVAIGPLGVGGNPDYFVSVNAAFWDGRDNSGQLAPPAVYGYTLSLAIVRVDEKGKEKSVSSDVLISGSITVVPPHSFPLVLQNQNLTNFFVTYASVQAGQEAVFALKNCWTGHDPILDVFHRKDELTGKYTRVTSNDDYQFVVSCTRKGWSMECRRPVGSRVSLVPTQSESVMLVVRAKTEVTAGYCELWVGAENWGLIYFGGVRIVGIVRDGDELQTVPVTDHDSMIIFAEPKTYFVRNSQTDPTYDDDSGVGNAARLRSDTWGAVLAYVGSRRRAEWGLANIYLNDAALPGHDDDGDGLGDELETALGTCPVDTCTYSCGDGCTKTVFNAQDTDGDGLTDAVEVFGCDKMCYELGGRDLLKPGCYVVPQDCPGGRLAKDSFAQELPKWGASPLHADLFVEVDKIRPASPMKPEWAAELAKRYSDPTSNLWNPDGTTGVNAHLDIGAACAGTVCGDWGGYTPDVPPENSASSAYDGGHIGAIRKGLFRYALGMEGSGGTTPLEPHNNKFEYGTGNDSIAWAIATHESGHTVGIGHEGYAEKGAFNCKPQYPSLMNYAYSYELDGSIDNIRFSPGRFDNEGLSYRMNPANLCETAGLATADVRNLSFLQASPFRFYVDTYPQSPTFAGIDWNRDGVVSDCTQPVRSYVHYAPGTECDGLGYRKNDAIHILDQYFTSTATPNLAVHDDHLYLFFKEGWTGRISVLRFVGFFFCENDVKKPCDEWHDWGWVTEQEIDGSPAAASLTMENGEKRLYVFYRAGDSHYFKYLSPDGHWSDEALFATDVTHSPAAVKYRDALLVVFVGQNGRLYYQALRGDETWTDAVPVVDGDGNALQSSVSPSLAVVPYFGGSTDQSIVHIIYGQGIEKHLWMRYLDASTATWRLGMNTGQQTYAYVWNPVRSASHKVGFAWLPDNSMVNGGRFHMIYRKPDDDIPRYDFMTARSPGAWWQWNMDGLLDNVYTHTPYGGSMVYFEHEQRTGLWASFVDATNYRIRFIPYADGIYDYELSDADDWKPMERGLCLPVRGEAFCGPRVYRVIPWLPGQR
jgi:hypothetical protein